MQNIKLLPVTAGATQLPLHCQWVDLGKKFQSEQNTFPYH